MAIDIATALRAYSATPKADAGAGAPAAPVAASGGFGDVLSSTIEDAVKTTKAGEAAMNASAAGKAELVDVVTAVANAETTLETVISLRDRVITAYQEIMRMPI
ncbi:MAG: flagellar hook-basal body complex protein FliE [Alphaproteobacteria bacterium]